VTFSIRPNLAFDSHQELYEKLIGVFSPSCVGAKLLGRPSCSEVKRMAACVLVGSLWQRAAVLAWHGKSDAK